MLLAPIWSVLRMSLNNFLNEMLWKLIRKLNTIDFFIYRAWNVNHTSLTDRSLNGSSALLYFRSGVEWGCVCVCVCVFVQILVDMITSDEAAEKTDTRRSGQTHQPWRTLTAGAERANPQRVCAVQASSKSCNQTAGWKGWFSAN